MNKLILTSLIASSLLFGSYGYNGSTTAAITVIGGIIKAQSVNIEKKYKRKDCPVCKGSGWYISGDKITKVPCGYCEPDKTQSQKVVVHPQVIISQPNCINGNCTNLSQGSINARK
jgi:hypothetical protein